MGKDYIKLELDRVAENAEPGEAFDVLTRHGRAKYEAHQREAAANPQLQQHWKELHQIYVAAMHGKEQRRITLQLLSQPNFHGESSVGSAVYRDFVERFPKFCAKFELYGMDGNQPLLLKPSAIVTDVGTVVYYPKYWNIDSVRDIDGKQVTKAHKVHGSRRQGKILGQIRRDRLVRIKQILRANEKALKRGLEGKARYTYIIEEVGLADNTDHRYINRLIKAGEKLQAEEKL